MANVIRKYYLKSDISYDISDFYCGADIIFYDFVNKSKVIGFIENGILNIKKGFVWDGCTPKFRLFGIIFGVPDFDETYKASAIHDFLITYADNISRLQKDNIFEHVLYSEKFKHAWLYSTAVHEYRRIRDSIEAICSSLSG